MSIEHDITYTWAYGSAKITQARAIVSDVAGALDLAVPSGSTNYPADFALTVAKAQSIFLVCDQAVTLKSGGTNAVQSLSITGSPTGGTFTITFGGHTTAAVAYDATAAAVQSALEALASVGTGGVSCSGGPLPGTPVAVTFLTLNAVQVVAALTTADSLTGGSSPATAVTTTTAGVAPDTTISLLAGVPLVWDAAAYFAQPFAADVTWLHVTNASGVGANLKLRTLASA